MSGGPWAMAVSAQQASAYMAKMQAEAQKNNIERKARGLSLCALPPGKCPGCGSHEFHKHKGRTICAYCRIAPA